MVYTINVNDKKYRTTSKEQAISLYIKDVLSTCNTVEECKDMKSELLNSCENILENLGIGVKSNKSSFKRKVNTLVQDRIIRINVIATK